MLKQDYIEKIATYIADSWLPPMPATRRFALRPSRVLCVPPSKPPASLVTRPAIGSLNLNSARLTFIRTQVGRGAALCRAGPLHH